jgi:hypothetical protein
MISELIAARLGTTLAEDNPALAGSTPPVTGRRRPLEDAAGRPLLPRIVRALRQGLSLPAPHELVQPGAAAAGVRAGLGPAGMGRAAFDPAWVPATRQRAWVLRGEALGRLLARAARVARVALGLGAWLQRGFTPRPAQPTALERWRAPGSTGALDVPPDDEQRRAQFYGRGL